MPKYKFKEIMPGYITVSRTESGKQALERKRKEIMGSGTCRASKKQDKPKKNKGGHRNR